MKYNHRPYIKQASENLITKGLPCTITNLIDEYKKIKQDRTNHIFDELADRPEVMIAMSDIENGTIPAAAFEDTCFKYGITGNCPICPLKNNCPNK